MRYLRLIIVTSILTGLGALAGVLAGRPLGRRTAMLGAMVGGTLTLLAALRFVGRLGWFDPDRLKGGSIGGLVGLGLASPLAVMTGQHVGVLIAASALVGVGVLVGAGPSAAR